jgi:hypothetical protein
MSIVTKRNIIGKINIRMKIKYPPGAIKKCDQELKTLMKLVIESKIGGTTINGSKGPSRRLIMRSGDLLDSVNPVIKVVNDKLIIDIEVVKYYQWLDTGSRNIKNPWFLTQEFEDNIKVIESIERLTKAGIEFTIKDMLNIKIKI